MIIAGDAIQNSIGGVLGLTPLLVSDKHTSMQLGCGDGGGAVAQVLTLDVIFGSLQAWATRWQTL